MEHISCVKGQHVIIIKKKNNLTEIYYTTMPNDLMSQEISRRSRAKLLLITVVEVRLTMALNNTMEATPRQVTDTTALTGTR